MNSVDLTRHFLIAMPAMADPHFAKTLTLVCEHNENGALGIINASSTFTTNLGFRVAVNGSSGEAVSVWENPEGTQGVNDLWTFAGEQDLRVAGYERPGLAINT